MQTTASVLDDAMILTYLGLQEDYQPSPSSEPIEFLKRHLQKLPPQLLGHFSSTTTPKQRTIIPTIRNRRLKFTSSQPADLFFESAKSKWPTLWQGKRERAGQEERVDEKDWADRQFLGGEKQHIGKLGNLLGDIAEEREAERARSQRRLAVQPDEEFVPEEEDESEDSEDGNTPASVPEDSPGELREHFERLVRERFIYGLLDSIDYNAVDWNDHWDADNDREDEERWFDEEEEGD